MLKYVLIQNMRIDVILFSVFVNPRESTKLWNKNELWNLIAFDFLLLSCKRCETWNDSYANSKCETRESFNYFHFNGISIVRVLLLS